MSDITPIFDPLRLKLAQSLIACRASSSKRAVHAVRTGARRLEALLRKVLEDHPDATGLHRETRKTLLQLKRIRKMAGPVRDLDVHRKLAGQISRQMLAHKTGDPREDLTREHERLDLDLAKRRDQKATALRGELTKRELPLEKSLERTAKEIADLTADFPSPLATARQWAQRAATRFGQVDEAKLHDFRKHTKAARYVAELQPKSRAAQRFAKQLHHVQEAIGKWHDWDLLTQEAKSVLGKRAQTVVELKKKRNRALTAALRVETIEQPKVAPARPPQSLNNRY